MVECGNFTSEDLLCPQDLPLLFRWGHYVGQNVCVFDDFHSGWFPLTRLLRLMDSTPALVSPKGQQVPFTSGTLVFTSNVDPRDWYGSYKGKKAHKDALERRIQDFAEVIDCTKTGVTLPRGGVAWSYHRKKRTELFEFRDNQSWDFSNQTNRDGFGSPAAFVY